MWILWTLLSVSAWAIVNVLDSVLVHRFERHPLALMWSQSLVSVPTIAFLSFFVPVATPWAGFLFLFGIIGYLGDVWFFHVLRHVDVSVSNIAWSILSLFLAIAGFFLFHEAWGSLQTVGAVLILGGTLLVSGLHTGVRMRHMLLLVCILASLYLPYYVAKKFAIDAGVLPLTVFFWMLAGRETLSFSTPLFFPRVRQAATRAMRASRSFMVVNASVIGLFLLAEFFGVLAYRSGPLSLVAITSNIQPFLVMALAWLIVRYRPTHAAKELLSKQSVAVKLASFSLVFLGLAFLGVSH